VNIEWVPPGGSRTETVRDDLLRLYASTYSTAEYFDIFHGRNVNDCWLLRVSSAGELKHLLVLSPDAGSVTLLNEMITVEKEDLDQVAAAVFAQFPSARRFSVNRTRLHGAESSPGRRGFRHQGINDAVLDLPATAEAYRQLLGSQTRKHVAYYHNRLRKSFPDFQIDFICASGVSAEHIGRIVEMNRGRLKSKGGRSGIDESYEKRLLFLARAYGFLCICRADGKTIAGSICTKAGPEAYLHVIAHDPVYDKYNAGQVCLFNSIIHLVEDGCTRFHMLWGHSEYKYRFGAKDEDLGFYWIYRSSFLRTGAVAAFMLGSAVKRIMSLPVRVFRKVAGNG
jgi:CelD/BcsL family acetyltransferase involved in cellulose biosynthesis